MPGGRWNSARFFGSLGFAPHSLAVDVQQPQELDSFGVEALVPVALLQVVSRMPSPAASRKSW